MMPNPLKKVLVTVILLAAIALSAVGLTDRGLDLCGLGYLDRTNASYLNTAFDKALSGFLLLSGIKSGLAVIEGSEVGVGFNLQIGDVVQPLYDYVDIAWRAALTGGSIIAGMQLALKGLDVVDQWALTLLLVLVLGGVGLKWWKPDWESIHQVFRQTGRFFLMLCLSLYLLLPLAVTGAAVLSRQITAPLVEDTHAKLRELGEALTPEQINQRFFSGAEASGLAAFDLKSRLNKAGEGVKELMAYLKTTTEELAALTLKLIAAYVFDCILFPLFFGLIFMTMLKSGVAYLFDLKRN